MAKREEGLWMSTKERDRLKVLHEVKKRHITQKQAGISPPDVNEIRPEEYALAANEPCKSPMSFCAREN